MRYSRFHRAAAVAAVLVSGFAAAGLGTGLASAAPGRPAHYASGAGHAAVLSSPGASMAFDEAGPSTGTGDNWTTSQWNTIKADGFKLFITDPVNYSSECSDGNCTGPEVGCTLNSSAVSQIQDAYNIGVDYAIYTRNPLCLLPAINGLSSTLRTHMSFVIFDIEAAPGIAVTPNMWNAVKAKEHPVIYSDGGDWNGVMASGNTLWSADTLDVAMVPNWNATYPAPYPSGYPVMMTIPAFGGWSGNAPPVEVEQQQCCTSLHALNGSGVVGDTNDRSDIDSVNTSWLASLPQA